jgi:serine/threonine protein kinase
MYQAPEILLNNKYNKSADIWCFGCILAEFFTKIPLFAPNNLKDEIEMIFSILGKPN